MVRSRDDVFTVQVLPEHSDQNSTLLRTFDRRAPKAGQEVLCVGLDGRCVAAPGLVVSRLDESTFRIERA